MKVLNINNAPNYGANSYAQRTNNTKNNKNISLNVRPMHDVLPDKNYGILQTKPMNVSFKGHFVPAPIQTLSSKINNVLNIVKTNDLIVVSKDYKTGVKALQENVSGFKTVLKRVFFIEDKKLDRTIGFRKNLADREAVNLSDDLLFIKDSKKESSFLKKGESGFLLDGDTIIAGEQEIKIKEDDYMWLPLKENYTRFVNLEKEINPKITEINEFAMSKLGGETKQKKPANGITFADVGGMGDTIKELKKNILFPIKYPEIKNGKNMRKSILMYGAPGTGKSFVAEACANESGAWYKKINASELDSKWVGESEENWRNLFDEARKNQPSVIFIDEIDAIAKKRGGTDTYGDKTLNTILGLMSDSEKRGDQIYMIAATNRRNMLDDAVLRSGRFGLSIEVPTPDLKGTEDILNKYIQNEPIAKNFDKQAVVQKLFNKKSTGADIAAVTEDARNAALEREKIFEKMDNGTYTPEDLKKLRIKNVDFDKAIDSLKTDKAANRAPIGFNSSLYK